MTRVQAIAEAAKKTSHETARIVEALKREALARETFRSRVEREGFRGLA